MKPDIDIKDLMSAVDVPADWVGIREVYEAHTPRMIRDGVPVANGRFASHGLMVEVLTDGQFGYYGTPDLTPEGVSRASKKAFVQAKHAAQHAVCSFTSQARPKNVGRYQSPFAREKDSISAGQLNKILLDAYAYLKVSDKIISARALAQTIETIFRFISSNGSDITQDFLMVEFDLSATAVEGTNQQTRTFGGMRGNCLQIGMEYFDQLGIMAHAQKIGE